LPSTIHLALGWCHDPGWQTPHVPALFHAGLVQMIDAQAIAEALDGRRIGDSYRSACPCCGGSDKATKFSIKDAGDRVLIHCHAGCEFIDIVTELRSRGLWPEPDKLPTLQAISYQQRKTRIEIEEALNHELNVLMQYIGWRCAGRHVTTPRPGWKRLPDEHWGREVLAAQRIKQALRELYE